MDDNIKKFVNISLWVVAILLVLRSLISWAEIKSMWESRLVIEFCYTYLGYIGEVIGATAIIMSVFNKCAWKWKVLRWTHDLPVFKQKYDGKFVSDYDKKTRKASIEIEQTFLKINVQMKTKESSSGSIVASLKDLHGKKYLIYTYQNNPHAEIQDRSPIHYGTAMLDVSNPKRLEGNYFTGRKSRGSMMFESSNGTTG